MISRRVLLAGTLGFSACAPKLAKPFNGYALVANRGSRTLAVVNLTRFKTEQQIALPSAPDQIVTHNGGHAALVLLPGSGTVLEVTAESLTVGRRIRVGSQATLMRLSGDGQRLWVLTREPAALVPINLNTWKHERSVALRGPCRDFDIALQGGAAVVAYDGRNQCDLIDLATAKVTAELGLPSEASVVRFRPDGKQVLIGSAANRTITFVDPAIGRTLVGAPVAVAPERFCFSTGTGGQMFVTGPGMDAVAIVYPYQAEVAQTLLAGREPGAMAVNDTQLFVTNPPTGDVTVISIAEQQVVARIDSGQEPCAIVLTPDGEYVLIINRKSCDMAVVRISKLTDLRYKRAPLFTIIAVGEEPVAAAVVRL